MLRDITPLPLLERETHTLVGVILGVSGIFMVLNADEVRVNGGRIEV
jgi:hypothetical protein